MLSKKSTWVENNHRSDVDITMQVAIVVDTVTGGQIMPFPTVFVLIITTFSHGTTVRVVWLINPFITN